MLYNAIAIGLLVTQLIVFAAGKPSWPNSDQSSSKDQQCPPAYATCDTGMPGYINVHIVPHTHDDVGWLKTVDQYYYGSNIGQQMASVQYVLDTVVQELAKDARRRFVYVEIAYFWRWWNEQDDTTKQLVRTLVNEGRLEFVIGAWLTSLLLAS
jgi:lysosomal alpha-mannosidase